MVGLADIPFVGRVVERISDAAVDAMFRGFRYMFRSKDLVKILDTQVENANTEKDRVSREVAKELSNGKLIEDHVLKWQKEAEEIRESAKELTEKYKNRHSWRCIQCLPIPNPFSRFRLGREAVRKTEMVTELINSGKELLANEIACLAPDENLPKSNTEFQNFQSREDIYGELWEALVTGSSPILGIYGMPGVGKTRMTELIENKISCQIIVLNKNSKVRIPFFPSKACASLRVLGSSLVSSKWMRAYFIFGIWYLIAATLSMRLSHRVSDNDFNVIP